MYFVYLLFMYVSICGFIDISVYVLSLCLALNGSFGLDLIGSQVVEF